MSRAPLVYRTRRPWARRVAEDLTFGTALAGLCFALQLVASMGEWLAFGILGLLTAVIAFGIGKAVRRRKAWIALYEDRVAWRDERGRHHEAPLSALSVIEPDPSRNSFRVWFRDHGALELSPEFERFTELRNRLQYAGKGGEIPAGRESWKVKRRYELQDRVGMGVGLGFGVGILLLVSGLGEQNLRFGLPALLLLIFGLRSCLRIWFERIEVIGDTLILSSWIPGIRRRIPIHSILGASRTSPSAFAGGVIDTDEGEIHIRSDVKEIDTLIAEAKRIGIARFQSQAAITERSSTA